MVSTISLNRKRNGRMFMRVWTRRGPRTRQITQDGVRWLRQKFPDGRLEDVTISYEIYRQMQNAGFIYVGKFPPRKVSEPQPSRIFSGESSSSSKTEFQADSVPLSGCGELPLELFEEIAGLLGPASAISGTRHFRRFPYGNRATLIPLKKRQFRASRASPSGIQRGENCEVRYQ